jgi:prepilin-type N-terminal cleavage/methylation domain-containing protein
MKQQQGYTVAELMVALLIFGLIISFIIPIFAEIKADAQEQTVVLESTQLMINQIEQLSTTCQAGGQGVTQLHGIATQIPYQLKWNCTRHVSVIKIHVEVQWKDKQGKLQTKQIETHRFMPNTASPI